MLRCRLIPLSLLFLLTSAVQAADYKAWLSLLPETVMGMTRAGEPDGANVTMGEMQNSSLTLRYRKGSGDHARHAEIMVIYDSSKSLIMPFSMVRDMRVETPQEIHKPTTLSGFDAIYQLDRQVPQNALIVILRPDLLINMTFQPPISEDAIMKFAAELPLAELAKSVP
ncbi:MAG TPA: hypothetical protein ENJ01_04955 [Gammaproteobacteria bacterium]|nr:hypothetical protein [Gammaproteobacteria bacterium]